MGQYRAALLCAHPALVLAATVDPDITAAPCAGRVPHYGSVLDALVRGGPYDCVWVAAPTRHHAAVVLAAAPAARPPRVVFCEKPIAGAVLPVAHCYHVCRQRGVALLCGWMRRLDAGYAQLARAAAAHRAAGAALVRATLVSADWPPVPRRVLRALGSIFEDLMCHDFNAAAFLMHDALPRWLAAEAHSSGRDDVPDTATCTIFFAPDDGDGGDDDDDHDQGDDDQGDGDGSNGSRTNGSENKSDGSSTNGSDGTDGSFQKDGGCTSGRSTNGRSNRKRRTKGTVFHITASRTSASGTYENSVELEWSDGTRAACGRDLRTHSFFERHDASYRAEVDLVAGVLAGTRTPADCPSTPASCLLTAALVELAEESARRGGERLRLNRPLLGALRAIASERSLALPSKL